MFYLLKLRRFLRLHPHFAVAFGGTLFVLSGVAAMLLRFAYFYSSFVVGLFLFFDAAAHLLDPALSFTSNLERIGKTFWLVLGGFIILTDLIAGQIVFSVWRYPVYTSLINWLLLYFIIYPVGGLSLIAMFRFFQLWFGRIFPGRFFVIANVQLLVKKILRLIFFALPLAIIIPLFLYLVGDVGVIAREWGWYALLFLFLFVEWTFFFDVLILAFGGQPILADFLSGDRQTILAVAISGLLGAFLHEVINTYVHEWTYVAENFPVTQALFLGVPVMVFVAWIPLTIVCVQAYRFATVVKEGNFWEVLRRQYLG